MSERESVSPIRVLLADDQNLFAESLKLVIETHAEDIVVVGIAGNGREAIEKVAAVNPDVVLLDIRMPEVDGVEASYAIHLSYPEVKILVLTMFDDDEYVYEAIQNGASGYLLKEMSGHEVIAAIRMVHTSGLILSPSIGARITEKAYGTAALLEGNEQADDPLMKLTRRDREVLDLVAEGLDNKEIAQQLNLAEQTVKNRVSELYLKLDVPDRLHLIRRVKSIGSLE